MRATMANAYKAAGFLAAGLCGLLIACGGEEAGDDGPDGAAQFKTTIAPFEAAKLGTNGYQPKTGPAQLSLEVNAKGALTVQGGGDIADAKLVGTVGSGKLALDAGFSLEGKLKVATGIPGAPTYDDAIPGLKDISTPLVGQIAFDPFLVADKNAELVVKVPKTALPEIKLGTFPGKLALTISDKSEIHMTFQGTCVGVTGKKPSWTGDLTPSGTLVIDAAVNLDVDVPTIGKTIKLPSVSIPIKLGVKALDVASTSTVDVPDGREGSKCANGPGSQTPPGGNEPSDGGVDAKADGGMNVSDGGQPVTTTCATKQTALCPATVLTIRGDDGNDVVSTTGKGFGWVRVHVEESTKFSAPLGLNVKMSGQNGIWFYSAVGIGFGTASCGDFAPTPFTVKADHDDVSMTAAVSWPDKSAADDSLDFLIRVDVGLCADWTLTIHR